MMESAEGHIQAVTAMDRDGLIHAIRSLKCEFPNDLTSQYLRTLPLERLRHIYMAMLLHARRPRRADS